MRRVNPKWNSLNHNTNFSNNVTNALGIFIEIRMKAHQYQLYIWDGAYREIGVFSTMQDAESFAKAYRSHLMPTQRIEDIRFVPDKKITPPKPKKQEKAIMTPVPICGNNFSSIDESDGIEVEHPKDIITF